MAACHFPGRSSKAVGVEQRLMELAPLIPAHVAQRRVADDLLSTRRLSSALAIGRA
jgi:hypothetical protein